MARVVALGFSRSNQSNLPKSLSLIVLIVGTDSVSICNVFSVLWYFPPGRFSYHTHILITRICDRYI